MGWIIFFVIIVFVSIAGNALEKWFRKGEDRIDDLEERISVIEDKIGGNNKDCLI